LSVYHLISSKRRGGRRNPGWVSNIQVTALEVARRAIGEASQNRRKIVQTNRTHAMGLEKKSRILLTERKKLRKGWERIPWGS